MSPNRPSTALIDVPTFDTIWEDMRLANQRANQRATPLIAAKEIASTSSSALFSGNDSSAVNPDVDMEVPRSPSLSDSEIGQIINIDGASWATEMDSATDESLTISPIRLTHPEAAIPPSRQFILYSLLGVPTICSTLLEADAPFWAAVCLDIQRCLWAKMSQKLVGRGPTKTLFLEVLSEATSRQTTCWKAVAVVLSVPRVANAGVSRDMMIETAFQTKGMLDVIEVEAITTPRNSNFILALILAFTAAWVRQRSFCYGKAGLVVLPHSVHVYYGLLPHPQEFTVAFRLKLQNLISDQSRGSGLLHEHPSMLASPDASAPFPWFGNFLLREVVHRALYDPTYAGWFGFLEDVRMNDGRRFWAPLQVASYAQLAQVLGWIEELLMFHVMQANKAKPSFNAFIQPPANFTSHDSVIKRSNCYMKFLGFLAGDTGDLRGPDDPFVWIGHNPDVLQACTDGYSAFIERPDYLPYDVSDFVPA